MENDPSLYQTSAIIPWSFGFNIPSVLTVFHRLTTINPHQPSKMPSDFLNILLAGFTSLKKTFSVRFKHEKVTYHIPYPANEKAPAQCEMPPLHRILKSLF
jgi:hypothetical protein